MNSMTFNPIICSTCLIRLKNSYQFATECLKNQQLIEKYADTYGTTERLVNINEMIETKFRNSDEANLSNIESEVCTSNIPPLPTNTTKKTNSKKYTHDSPIAKKRKTYHAPPEEDSLISSNDETSNIKVEPDEDDHSGLLIQGEPKREILDSDSLDSDSMIKIEPDYIDCPDFIKSEPEDNEHIENAAFNNRTGIGPDIQTNRAERHGSENVTLSRTNVSLSKRGSVFSNVDFSTEATTSDVIK
ncbi:hypothetical protein NQ314_016423 [Rhamnusium bicolor]|uniref:ZAD domain-containing protein n=1 Tax=Rhamnusium bicolor TaxID=1586634 RepID=A0AAV8WWA7_9CUCU|nr:hypothetical protein NQ314_016423 [Rhamnusium bicolor]